MSLGKIPHSVRDACKSGKFLSRQIGEVDLFPQFVGIPNKVRDLPSTFSSVEIISGKTYLILSKNKKQESKKYKGKAL